MSQYVLVQHSAWGYSGDPQFKGGLEHRTVSSHQKIAKLKELGAVLLSSYHEAEETAHALMYPEGYGGLIPVASRNGSFCRTKVDGLNVFIPNENSKLSVDHHPV